MSFLLRIDPSVVFLRGMTNGKYVSFIWSNLWISETIYRTRPPYNNLLQEMGRIFSSDLVNTINCPNFLSDGMSQEAIGSDDARCL